MKKLFVEKVELDDKGKFLSSKVIPASKKDVKKFKSKPCNHDLCVDKLIYDVSGFVYDSRFCGVCDGFISLI